MPQTLTFPGVYIEEVPSGVRPITGVATSITAFVGRALRGPVDEAIVITSYADFERIFGGLWLESNLGYAVQDFYRNGGSMAIIVRVHKAKANDSATLSLGRRRSQARSRRGFTRRVGSEAHRDDRPGRQQSERHVALQPHGHRHRNGKERVVPQRLVHDAERATRRFSSWPTSRASCG